MPQLTEVISNRQLTASIGASDVATARTASITVTNSAPGGGTSNVVFFPVTESSWSGARHGHGTQAFPNATAVAAGDFNNDGKLDVAWVANNTLYASLGNGKGGFGAPISRTRNSYRNEADGHRDFNGDGKLDLASIGSGSLRVFLGNGDGTFTQSYNQTVFDGGIEGLATADFNQDGHLDIYVGGWETGPMFFDIYLGNGDGTFNYSGEYQTGGYPVWGIYPGIPAVGDFNGDGYLDLAVAGDAEGGGTSGSGVRLGKLLRNLY